jgi:hypothetical protein
MLKIYIQLYSHGENTKTNTNSNAYQDCLVPDIFQNFMSNLVQDMEYVKKPSYFDNL